MSPAVAVMPPSETIFTSSRLEQMRHTQNTMPITRKGRDTVRFIGLVFYVVFKHTGGARRSASQVLQKFRLQRYDFFAHSQTGLSGGVARMCCRSGAPRIRHEGRIPVCGRGSPLGCGYGDCESVTLRVWALRVCVPVLCRCVPRPCRQSRTRSRATRFFRPRWGCAGAGRG